MQLELFADPKPAAPSPAAALPPRQDARQPFASKPLAPWRPAARPAMRSPRRLVAGRARFWSMPHLRQSA